MQRPVAVPLSVVFCVLLLSQACHAEDAAVWGVSPDPTLRFGEVAVEPFDINEAVLHLMKWLTEKGVTGLEPNTSALEPYLYPDSSVGGDGAVSEGQEAKDAFAEVPSEGSTCKWDASGDSSKQGAAWLRPELAIRSKYEIEGEHTLILFPNNVLLSADKVASWEPHLLPYNVDTEGSFWTSYTVLAAWLLRERAKGTASSWHPFIRVLPGFVHTPLLFSREAVNATECDRLKELIPFVEQGVTSEYAKSRPETIANASLSEFVWAMSIIASRCFSSNGTLPRDALSRGNGSTVGTGSKTEAQVAGPASPGSPAEVSEGESQGGGEVGVGTEASGPEVSSGESGSEESGEDGEPRVTPVTQEEKEEAQEESRFEQAVMLLPYGDLLNHDMYPNTYWEIYRGEFYIVTDGTIPRGAEVTLSYGGKSSEEYLLAYGFLPVRNPHDYVFLFDDVREVLDYFAASVLPGGRFVGEEQQSEEECGKQAEEGHQGGEERNGEEEGATEGARGDEPSQGIGDRREGWEQGEENKPEGLRGSRAWAVDIVRRAEEKVQVEVEKGDWEILKERFHTLFGESATDSYLGWVGGRVEPRLLAILSALWFRWNHTSEDVDYESLANATMVLGMGFETDINCEKLEADALIQAGMGEALGMAAQMVRRWSQQKLRAMRWSAKEDKEYLKLLTFCKGVVGREQRERYSARRRCSAGEEEGEQGREPGTGEVQGKDTRGAENLGSGTQSAGEREGGREGGGEGEGGRVFQAEECTPFIRSHLKELKILITLQMRKKEILSEVKDRMAWTCDPAYEPFRQVILHGANLELPDENDIV